MNKQNLYCQNCGKKGHIYRACQFPIISLGIICIKYNKSINKMLKKYTIIKEVDEEKRKYIKNNLKFLIICRKNSIGYFEFLRGKYSFDNIKYLVGLFNIMTKDEKKMIKENDFETLWNNLWNDLSRKHNYSDIKQAEYKFNSLKKGYLHKKTNKIIHIDDIIGQSTTNWTDPEWGFPKGRRNLKETDKECAVREFKEETSLTDDDYDILQIDPISEIFKGTNDVNYLHKYFLAEYNSDKELEIRDDNPFQYNEISQIKWVSFDEALDLIRNYSDAKLEMLKKVYSILETIIINSDT